MKKCFNQQIFKRMMMGIIAAALFVIWAMDFVNAGTFKPEELEIVWTDFELYNDFKEGLTLTKDKKYLINKKGEIVFRPNEQFDSFEGFSDGLAAFSKDYKKGYINLQGKIVIPAQFDYAEEFWDGLARVVNDSKSGFINKQGKLVIPMKYDLATPFIEGFSWVTRNNKIFYVDKKGVERSIDHYENMAYVYSDGLSWMKENGKYGYIDKQGNVAIPFVYNSADYFSEGLGLVRQGKKKMISLQIGKDYVANGNELKAGNQQNKKAVKSTAKIEVNGKEITPTTYTIDGNNYFKLRELGDALNFIVKWNDAAQRIEVEMK